jgi:TRAP-type mannitol/chloroaromatic compound transport system substrate-binding protein
MSGQKHQLDPDLIAESEWDNRPISEKELFLVASHDDGDYEHVHLNESPIEKLPEPTPYVLNEAEKQWIALYTQKTGTTPDLSLALLMSGKINFYDFAWQNIQWYQHYTEDIYLEISSNIPKIELE